ncbi:dihydrolipoamide acetyltransferase family protein [Alkalimarinus alittae]|uniref:Dihydrolipoamide acetyltransferase component of pyruvate dehydrogenase complex n=1 Tax=Alkalimarinus alittae TaxID=2961619 RepID=A0ABY6N311_9ALTE|nr:dihydrolipoamide acetyltransferase family protein [Alkalimarinus alittae]UZE96479.1 2-oxo acid dehydrogenase subunit E2 [Alkalimarinus alittae]
MKYFKLPDLGEGLPEAEIVRWHIKVGDTVKTDQLMVEVETAKAIVEIPCPQDGTIMALFGEDGDIIHTGEPLVEFQSDQADDGGTVVGKLETAETQSEDATADHFIIGAAPSSQQAHHTKTTPAVRALAKHLHVDLEQLTPAPGKQVISATDVEKAAELQQTHGEAQKLRGVRRTMAKTMALSHAQVVPVTLMDDADINGWKKDTDLTMRLVQAITQACQKSPNINAWFDGNSLSLRRLNDINIGIAVDSAEGLFVPVLNNVASRPLKDLRKGLDQMRADIKKRSIPAAQMQGATITLTNFGTIAGRYANPVVVPPQVAIIGCGVARDEVVARAGKMVIRKILPLSITFDHRAATGGEAARFMAALIDDLQRA